MSTGSKVSSLACKCVFYIKPEHNTKGADPMELNFEGFEMQNEIYQRIELKK